MVTAERILVATGSWPNLPSIPGIEHAVTSNEMFHLDALPERAVVVGGGYIAVEFAGILKGLGVETTLMYRGPLILRGFDDGVRSFVTDELRKKGIDVRTQTNVTQIERAADGRLTLHLAGESAGADESLIEGESGSMSADLVMYATGRRPLSEGMGLEEIGVEMKPNGAILVDDAFRTSVPNIYAIGDVIDRYQLTPVAIGEGMALARSLYGDSGQVPMDYDAIPTAVFCQPNIGTVGMTEEQARGALRRHRRVRIHLPAHEAHHRGGRGTYVHEADRGHDQRPGRRRAHGGPGCRRDHPGPRRGHQGGRHEGAVRRDGRHPPHGRRGVRHHARGRAYLRRGTPRDSRRSGSMAALAAGLWPACSRVRKRMPRACS